MLWPVALTYVEHKPNEWDIQFWSLLEMMNGAPWAISRSASTIYRKLYRVWTNMTQMFSLILVTEAETVSLFPSTSLFYC